MVGSGVTLVAGSDKVVGSGVTLVAGSDKVVGSGVTVEAGSVIDGGRWCNSAGRALY